VIAAFIAEHIACEAAQFLVDARQQFRKRKAAGGDERWFIIGTPLG
jgi:hypothetical protein